MPVPVTRYLRSADRVMVACRQREQGPGPRPGQEPEPGAGSREPEQEQEQEQGERQCAHPLVTKCSGKAIQSTPTPFSRKLLLKLTTTILCRLARRQSATKPRTWLSHFQTLVASGRRPDMNCPQERCRSDAGGSGAGEAAARTLFLEGAQ